MPDAVLALDAFLNARILSARSTSEIRRWWTLKVRAKRLLAGAEPRELGPLAARILGALQSRAITVARAA